MQLLLVPFRRDYNGEGILHQCHFHNSVALKLDIPLILPSWLSRKDLHSPRSATASNLNLLAHHTRTSQSNACR